MHPAHTAEADAFAMAMIVVMVSAFAVIGLIIFSIVRNAAKRNRDVEELLEEVERQESSEEKTLVPSSRESWEKEGDWWKKG